MNVVLRMFLDGDAELHIGGERVVISSETSLRGLCALVPMCTTVHVSNYGCHYASRVAARYARLLGIETIIDGIVSPSPALPIGWWCEGRHDELALRTFDAYATVRPTGELSVYGEVSGTQMRQLLVIARRVRATSVMEVVNALV